VNQNQAYEVFLPPVLGVLCDSRERSERVVNRGFDLEFNVL